MTNNFLFFILICFSFVAYSDSFEDEKAAKARIFKQFGVPDKAKPNPVIETQLQASETNFQNSNDNDTQNLAEQDSDKLELEQGSGSALNPDDPNVPSSPMAGIDIKKIQEMAENMQASGDGKTETFDGGFLGKIMSDQMKQAAAQMMKSNPFKMMSDDTIKSMILGRFKPESPIGKFFANNPRAVDGTVAWVKDEHAIPAFISIINKPDKMKHFGYSVLTIFIIAFLLNLKNGKNGLLKRLVFKLLMMASTGVINLCVFYFLFRDELQPSINVISKYL
jgi:hypothetical protein